MTIDNDKSSLLDSLKIERSAPVRRRGVSPWLYAGIAVLVTLGGAAGWYPCGHSGCGCGDEDSFILCEG